jgi:hypothetical protein
VVGEQLEDAVVGEVLDPGAVVEGLRGGVPRGLVAFELDDMETPVAVDGE